MLGQVTRDKNVAVMKTIMTCDSKREHKMHAWDLESVPNDTGGYTIALKECGGYLIIDGTDYSPSGHRKRECAKLNAHVGHIWQYYGSINAREPELVFCTGSGRRGSYNY